MSLPLAPAVLLAALLVGGLPVVAASPDRQPAGPPTGTPVSVAGAAGVPSAARWVRAPSSGPAGAADEPTAPTAPTWGWPLSGRPRVVRGFDPPPSPWLPGHRGVDLAAAPGDVVRSAGAGVVTFAGPLAGRGVITVTHGALRTTYEPVTASVGPGDSVRTGDRLGVLATGASHCGGVPSCLHWGLLRGSTYLDPLLLLGLGHPVLLPIPHRAG